MAIYVVRAGYGEHTDAFKKGGYCGIGWLHDEDFSDFNAEKSVIAELYHKASPEDHKIRAGIIIGQIYRFIAEIKEGDTIITPYNDGRLLIGRVTSGIYKKSDQTSPYTHRRRMEWDARDYDRKSFSIPLQNSLRGMQTCFRVRVEYETEVLGVRGEKVEETKKSRIDASTLTEDIRQRFLELDASEFELLVSYVLQSLGFEASQEQGHVGDGGIDYEGNLEVMGVASIKLQVQVKRYDRRPISEREIRMFRGALKSDYQGCFISLSKFAKKAYKSARDPEKTPINIIDGEKFVEIFIEEYREIMEVIYADDNKELADKLQVKETLVPV